MTTTHYTIPADQIVPTCIEDFYAVDVRFNCGMIPGCPQTTGYRLTFSPEGIPARRVQHGPMHPEFFADLSQEATVIASHHIPDNRPRIALAEGDTIEIIGYGTLTVQAPARFNYGFPVLVTA